MYVQYSNHPELKTEPSQHSTGVSIFIFCYFHLKKVGLPDAQMASWQAFNQSIAHCFQASTPTSKILICLAFNQSIV